MADFQLGVIIVLPLLVRTVVPNGVVLDIVEKSLRSVDRNDGRASARWREPSHPASCLSVRKRMSDNHSPGTDVGTTTVPSYPANPALTSTSADCADVNS